MVTKVSFSSKNRFLKLIKFKKWYISTLMNAYYVMRIKHFSFNKTLIFLCSLKKSPESLEINYFFCPFSLFLFRKIPYQNEQFHVKNIISPQRLIAINYFNKMPLIVESRKRFRNKTDEFSRCFVLFIWSKTVVSINTSVHLVRLLIRLFKFSVTLITYLRLAEKSRWVLTLF